MKKLFSILKLRQLATLVLLCSLFIFAAPNAKAATYRATLTGTTWLLERTSSTPIDTIATRPFTFAANDSITINGACTNADLQALGNVSANTWANITFTNGFTADATYSLTANNAITFNQTLTITAGTLTLNSAGTTTVTGAITNNGNTLSFENINNHVTLASHTGTGNIRFDDIFSVGNGSSISAGAIFINISEEARFATLTATVGNIEFSGLAFGSSLITSNTNSIVAKGDVIINHNINLNDGFIRSQEGNIQGIGIVEALSLTLTIDNNSTGNIGTVTYSTAGSGKTVVSHSPLKTNTPILNASTYSNVYDTDKSYGNVLIDNQSTNTLTVQSVNTHNPYPDEAASVIIKSKGNIQGNVGTNIEAYSLELFAGDATVIPYTTTTNISNITTDVRFLTANTSNGDIVITNIADKLAINEINARDEGYMATLNGDMTVKTNGANGVNYIDLTNNNGPIFCVNGISAPATATLTSNGGIYAFIDKDSVSKFTITARITNLNTSGSVGLALFPLNLITGDLLNVNTNGDVYINANNYLPVGNIHGGDLVKLDALNGVCNFVNPTSTITATEKVIINVPSGNINDATNTNLSKTMRIVAKDAALS
ncbi:MAG: META domain-containing protein, partial [Bacteroidales bacterium]|nr:META domain-containing protein [Bacteroidales bacterium]